MKCPRSLPHTWLTVWLNLSFSLGSECPRASQQPAVLPALAGLCLTLPSLTPVCLTVPWSLKDRSVHLAEVCLFHYSQRLGVGGPFLLRTLESLSARKCSVFVFVTSLLSIFFLGSFRSASSWSFRSLCSSPCISDIICTFCLCLFISNSGTFSHV